MNIVSDSLSRGSVRKFSATKRIQFQFQVRSRENYFYVAHVHCLNNPLNLSSSLCLPLILFRLIGHQLQTIIL